MKLDPLTASIQTGVSPLFSTVQSSTSAVGNAVAGAKKAIDTVSGLVNPSTARLSTSNLLSGSTGRQVPNVFNNTRNSPKIEEQDWRVKISLSNAETASKLFYQNAEQNAGNILYPLRATNGVVFPYTPNITFAYQANYQRLQPTHSNYPYFFYENSEVRPVDVVGDFTVQNKEEGRYLLAAMHFFRTLTKMFYANGPYAGNPPPLVYLDGYGAHLIKKIPCVVTSFTHTMEETVDYMPVGLSAGTVYDDNYGEQSVDDPNSITWVPMSSKLQVTLQPVYSREEVGKFNLEDYARGNMLTSIGGRFL